MKKIFILVASAIFAFGYDVLYDDVAGKQFTTTFEDETCVMSIYSDHTVKDTCTEDGEDPETDFGIWHIRNGRLIIDFAWLKHYDVYSWVAADSTSIYFDRIPTVGDMLHYNDAYDDDPADGTHDSGEDEITGIQEVANDKLVPDTTATATVDEIKGKKFIVDYVEDDGTELDIHLLFNADMTYEETIWFDDDDDNDSNNVQDMSESALGTWSVQDGVILRYITFTEPNENADEDGQPPYNMDPELSVFTVASRKGNGDVESVNLQFIEEDSGEIDFYSENGVVIKSIEDMGQVDEPAYPVTYENLVGKAIGIEKPTTPIGPLTCVTEFYPNLVGAFSCKDSNGVDVSLSFFTWYIENGYVIKHYSDSNANNQIFFTSSTVFEDSPAVGVHLTFKNALDYPQDGELSFDFFSLRKEIMSFGDIDYGDTSSVSPSIIMYLLN